MILNLNLTSNKNIYEPIVLGPGDRIFGNGYKLIADNSFPMVVVESSEALSPYSLVTIKNLITERTEQAPYMSNLGMYYPDVWVKCCTGFDFEGITCHRGGIAFQLDKDAHNGYLDKCKSMFNRVGIVSGDSGGANITDVHFHNVQLIGDGTWVNDDNLKWYNYGVYQKSDTVGDTYYEGVTVLRFDAGIHLEGSGKGYNNNLRMMGTVVDQCNEGLYLENFKNSILLGNQVMVYTKHGRFVKKIINCGITPAKYQNFNIFRGSVK